jgi:hypothetical protein
MAMSPSMDHILQIGMGFWPAKTLMSAVELGLHTRLGAASMTGPELERALGLHPRATYDFLDALLALGLIAREGDGPEARYANTPDTAHYLDRASPDYMGGLLEMANARLYPFWGDLTEALRTGQPQNESKHGGAPLFEALYADPARLEQFVGAMSGASLRNFQAFAEKIDFSGHATLADIGGAGGHLCLAVARARPHMRCTSYDLPPVEPIARRNIERAGLSDRVGTGTLDFFADDLPGADILTMGMVLHDWNLEVKKMLIGKAFAALRPGGVFVAIEALIDDARRVNAFGLLMSLNMIVETGDGFDYSGAQFADWCGEAGFARTQVVHLAGGTSAAIAYK